MSLNKKQLMELRRSLAEIRDRGRADQQSLAELTAGLAGASSGDLSNAPVHLGDKGTEEFMYDMGTVLLGNEESIVCEASAALRRMDEGNYGQCGNCGESIPLERLRAVPATRFCRHCAETEQETLAPRIDLNAGRPRSPADTLTDGSITTSAGDEPTAGLEADALLHLSRSRDGAAGTPGGGASGGGLAGGNFGHGDPLEREIEAEMEGGRPEDEVSEDVLVKTVAGSSGRNGDEQTTRNRPRNRAK